MNLRGQFITDKDGHINFRSIKPAGYPIPIDGPVGELLRAAGRHNMRPSHLHFLVYKPGFKTLISQIYDPTDKHIETDVQFGVTRHLIGNYVRHDGACPHDSNNNSPKVKAPWYTLAHTFVMENGTAKLPRPPITGKAQGERPEIPHLEPA
jgi:hydroxyquinol 1,2-dioxygenase